MLRAVLDTNIFVSHLLSRSGAPARILGLWLEGAFELCTSPAIVDEIGRTLSQPRLRSKYPISDEDVADLLAELRRTALVVPGEIDATGGVPGDPSDEMFLSCAMEAEADVIVSGDRHLLSLGSYRGVPILTAREFLALLR